MTFSAIFTGIIAIAKAVPKIAEIINQFIDLWVDYQLEKIEQEISSKRSKRLALISAIKKAESDNERKALSIILADISRS